MVFEVLGCLKPGQQRQPYHYIRSKPQNLSKIMRRLHSDCGCPVLVHIRWTDATALESAKWPVSPLAPYPSPRCPGGTGWGVDGGIFIVPPFAYCLFAYGDGPLFCAPSHAEHH